MGERWFDEVDDRSGGPIKPRTGGAPAERAHLSEAKAGGPVDFPARERAEPRSQGGTAGQVPRCASAEGAAQ
jgi:hypothetical protein